MDVVVDSSLWIDALGGETVAAIEDAIANGAIVLPPLVIAELLSGENSVRDREFIGQLLQEFACLRRAVSNVTIPDAHVAQCALDRDATLLARDHIFAHIAQHTSLRLSVLR